MHTRKVVEVMESRNSFAIRHHEIHPIIRIRIREVRGVGIYDA